MKMYGPFKINKGGETLVEAVSIQNNVFALLSFSLNVDTNLYIKASNK